MTAILVTLRSKYECNPGYKRVQIWLQSFLLGNKYDCKHWNFPLDEIRPEMRVRNAQRDFWNCTHICSLPETIALIHVFGPFWNQDFTHRLWSPYTIYDIWTPIKLLLQSYLDPPIYLTEIFWQIKKLFQAKHPKYDQSDIFSKSDKIETWI